MTSTGNKFFDLLEEMNLTNFSRQWRIPPHGENVVTFLSILAKRICFQRTSAFDKNAQVDKPLTMEELDIIKRLYAGEVPDATYDPYEPTTE